MDGTAMYFLKKAIKNFLYDASIVRLKLFKKQSKCFFLML